MGEGDAARRAEDIMTQVLECAPLDFYGPTHEAFEALDAAGQAALEPRAQ
jgi:hypothetical protein